MYIYDRKTASAKFLTRARPVSRPRPRYSVQLSGFFGDKSKPVKPRIRVGTYWANDFIKDCGDDRLRFSDNLARGFARAMVAQGHQWAVDHGSAHASPRDWLSFPDAKGTPLDNSDQMRGVDTTDFAYLVTHGGVTYVDKPHTGKPHFDEDLYVFRAGFGLNAPELPDDLFRVESTSRVNWSKCIWLNNKSRLGDKNLRWLVVDTCESLHLPGYVKGLQMKVDVTPAKLWHHAFHGLNMVLGFTNWSSDAWWTIQRGAAFGRRAGAGQRLTEAWLDEAYSYWVGDKPVALACGHNQADAVNRLRFDSVTAPFAKIPHDKIGAFAWSWRT